MGWGDVPAEKSEANAAGSWTPDALTGDAFSGICVVPFCKQINKQEPTMKGLGTSQETLFRSLATCNALQFILCCKEEMPTRAIFP